MERIDATGSLGAEYRQVRSNLIKKQDNQALRDVIEHTLVDDPDLRLLEPESRRVEQRSTEPLETETGGTAGA